ncbi:HD-GYP domain-containing protein [Anaerosporobacter sp.]|uniref:HD-GYP domain-containing protein n=1 Tax=Anaerosporobacter sp. TaxID=1872529 RepID=UPI00286F297B|nr:HD-GYP domain-containing protein [Anaerosporobacter sp.]
MKFKSIFLSKAVPGMTLARDILDFSGHILVARDTILTDKIITKLQFYSIQSLTVRIDEQGNITTDAVPMDSISQESHLSNIRDTEEFAQFQKKFYGCVEYFQNYLNNVIHNDAPLDVANLLHFTNDILETSRNMIHLFDMLNCMRNYDDNTYTHCVNVALICHVFGNWIKLPQEELEVLTLCGLFHDIGKLEIPQSIIMKPDKLTEDEYNVVKKHTLIGYELLKDKNIDERIKTAALMHHERLDGSGYPHQLNSTSIENFARIVSIADVYDALTSKRVYRDPLCPFEVLHIFEQEGYTKYDPAYLVVFFEQMFQTYVMNTVRLSDGSEGMIIMLNKHSLANPVVQVGNQFIDLSKNKSLSIQAII